MEMKKRDNLMIMLEKAEEGLRKENQKTVIFMTIYYIILCGIMMYAQNSNIKDIIVEAVILGSVISGLTISIYVFFTNVFTNKNSIEKTIARLKVEIDRLEQSDDFIDED